MAPNRATLLMKNSNFRNVVRFQQISLLSNGVHSAFVWTAKSIYMQSFFWQIRAQACLHCLLESFALLWRRLTTWDSHSGQFR